MQRDITDAIQKGLRFIATQQKSDGSFESYLSTQQYALDTKQPVRTTFIPSLILSAVAAVDEAHDHPTIRPKIVNFLLSQKSDLWSFNYWVSDEPLRKSRNYPDDLDDTFCALIALYKTKHELVTPAALSAAVKLLLSTEKQVGGPYRTWLVHHDSDKPWLDIDPAVNSNVLYFLSLVAEPTPTLRAYIEQLIKTGALKSPYYPNELQSIYYLSSAYTGSYVKQLLQVISSVLDKSEQYIPLYAALAMTAHINLDQTVEANEITQLLASQRPDGSWPSAGFCIDQRVGSYTYYNGCAALTTAFVLEALGLYRTSLQPKQVEQLQQPGTSTIKRDIYSHALSYCEDIDPELQKHIHAFLQKIGRSSNAQEILSLAEGFYASLKKTSNIPQPFFDTLCTASLYGWVAYTIYDDFLDDEGDPQLLSAANVAHRISYETFLQSVRKKAFQKQVRNTFNLIDVANNWEISHCRFAVSPHTVTIGQLPDYKDLSQLAHRSLGHILSPLAVLTTSGISVSSQDFKAIYKALTHYLIAKQLDDDTHDWQDDFQRGHISYVVGMILAETGVGPGVYNKDKLLMTMQKQFWNHTLLTTCDEMNRQIKLGRDSLQKASILKKNNIIEKLFQKIDISVQKTRTTQRQTIEFLDSYRNR